MNPASFSQAATLVPKSFISQAQGAHKRREKMILALLSNRRLPVEGWDDLTITLFLHELASMDSNNFVGLPLSCPLCSWFRLQCFSLCCCLIASDNVGVGEREGRVFSQLVKQRHFSMCHGIGRSGDLSEPQPKAAGSSLLVRLTTSMVLDAIRQCGSLLF